MKVAPSAPPVGEAPARARPLRVAAIVAGVLAAIAGGVVALFWLAAWILPSDAVGGAVAGSAGLVVSFLVGVVSFFSPCVLPLLPGYLSFASGLSATEVEGARGRARVVAGSLLFVLGFAVVFSLLGASAGYVGSLFSGPGSRENTLLLTRIAGAIVIVMGLAYLVPGAMRFMEVERRPLMKRMKQPGLGAAFPLGLAFAVGWTPCVGPGLGAILGLGSQASTATRGMLLLFSFSLGFGMWFVLAALGLRRLGGALGWIRRRARAIQVAGGAFMIAIGVAFLTGAWDAMLGPLRNLITNFAPPV